MQSLKVVVAGDGAVGKTTFLISFTLNCFPTDYVPTTFDNYNAVYPFEGRNINLGLWDTAGQADLEKLRPISYKQADVFLLFFSVVNPTSAENIKERWVEEVKEHCPGVPYFLVGTQVDQRELPKIIEELSERKQKPVGKKDGKKLAKEIGAVDYLECSAKNMIGHREIFDEVIRYVVNEYKKGKKPGKHCWSIDCWAKMNNMQRVKCTGRCKLFYCPDCIEVWDDGFRGCPQCVIYEREERQQKGKKIGNIKKARVPPAELAEKRLEKERIKEEKMRKKMEKQMSKQGSDVVSRGSGSDDEESEEKKERKSVSGTSEKA